MTSATQRRPQTLMPTDGSRTVTLRDAQPRPEDGAALDNAGPSTAERNTAVGVLKLRGVQRRTRRRVAWDSDVVDNEGCGKKKSKICCIYHKPRRFDESSSESESASSDSDSTGRNSDSGRARPTIRYRHASHGHGCRHNTAHQEGRGENVHELQQSDSDVNAYEKAPKRKS